MTISAGFMGKVTVGANAIYVSSCNIARKQGVQIPDTVMGTYKRVVGGADKISIEGSCSGPVTDSFSSIWNLAVDRTSVTCPQPELVDITVDMGCENDVHTYNVMINSATLSCTAGDVAQFSFDVIGRNTTSTGGSGTLGSGRVVTWDSISITGAPGTGDVASITMTVANACVPVYKIGSGTLWPDEIIGGIQTITGSVGIYGGTFDSAGWESQSLFSSGTGSITFGTLGTITGVTYHRPNPNLGVGPVIVEYPFTCTYIT